MSEHIPLATSEVEHDHIYSINRGVVNGFTVWGCSVGSCTDSIQVKQDEPGY